MKSVNVALLVILAAGVGANVLVNRDVAVPSRDYLPEMMYSSAAESFAAVEALGNLPVLRTPPEGTIAHDARLARYAPPAATVRGAAVFDAFCVPCHGRGGEGNGPVVSRGFPAPPSLLAPRAVALDDARLFDIITNGQGNMASYAGQVDEEDRWQAIAHIRQLQRGARP